jgi:hypothetical protein
MQIETGETVSLSLKLAGTQTILNISVKSRNTYYYVFLGRESLTDCLNRASFFLNSKNFPTILNWIKMNDFIYGYYS